MKVQAPCLSIRGSGHSNRQVPQIRISLKYKALRIRLVEERIIELYPSDKIQSPVHLSIGQEAVAVGACQSPWSTEAVPTAAPELRGARLPMPPARDYTRCIWAGPSAS